MDTLLELKKSVVEKQAAELAANWSRYQEILRRLVDGGKVDPAVVSQVLDAIGKSVDDIPADVDNVKCRDAIRKRAADAEAAKPQLLEAQAQLDRLKAEKQAFLGAIVPKIEDAVLERDRLVSVVNSGTGIDAELLASCRDPGLRAQLEAIDDEMRSVVARESDVAFRESYNQAGLYADQLSEIQQIKSRLHRRRREIEASMISQ